MSDPDYRITVLGSGGVGKSCLTVKLITGDFPDDYDPTIEDAYRTDIEVDGKTCRVEILDTAGQEQFRAMEDVYINNGNAFVLVYSVGDAKSFKTAEQLHDKIMRVKGTHNKVAMVLAGNKCDLPEESRQVSVADGEGLARKWGGIPFYETSAKENHNVVEIYIDVLRQCLRREYNLLHEPAAPAGPATPPQSTERMAAPAAGNKQYSADRLDIKTRVTIDKKTEPESEAGGCCVVM